MEQTPKIFLDLPESLFKRLEDHINRVVEDCLRKHIEAIKAEPELMTRAQVAKRLRITLPTLRRLETNGELIPERVGRKVFYDKRRVELFLKPK